MKQRAYKQWSILRADGRLAEFLDRSINTYPTRRECLVWCDVKGDRPVRVTVTIEKPKARKRRSKR